MCPGERQVRGQAGMGRRYARVVPILFWRCRRWLNASGDSLSRFGDIEVSCFQVTVLHMDADAVSQLGHLVSMLNWFNTNLETRAGAIVSFEQNLLGGSDVPELVTYLQRRNTGSFEFRSAVDVPEQHMVEVSTGEHFHPVKPLSDQGVPVIMPEWTPSAAGWVLASVINAARTIEPEPDSFAVRITRLQSRPVS